MKLRPKLSQERKTQQARVQKSGMFLAIFVINLFLFLLLGSTVIYHLVGAQALEPMATFKLKPQPPPPPKASSRGGDPARSLSDPSVVVVPPPVSLPSIVVSANAVSFNLSASATPLLSAPLPSLAQPQGTGLAQGSSGAGVPQSNPFGSSLEDSANPGLVGYLYDLKQTIDRSPTQMTSERYHQILTKFVFGWDEGMLSSYYKSPKPLNTSYIFIPTILASEGPKAFGLENEVQPNLYVIWYKLTVTPQQEGTYHFVGMADDVLMVRVNGQNVLDGSLYAVDQNLWSREARYPVTNYIPSNPVQEKGLFVGKGFQVQAHDQLNIDVLIGEQPGGFSNYFLYIQREESSYIIQRNKAPLLPIFHVGSDPIQPHGEPGSFPPFASDSPF